MEMMVVDDHPLVRQGIRSILKQEEQDGIIWEAGNVKEGLAIAAKHPVSIAVVDLMLNEESGFTFIEQSEKMGNKMKYIILSSSTRQSDLLKARELHVDGYIVKDAFVEDILYAMKLVKRGGQFFSPEIIRDMFQEKREEREEILTNREQEVLKLIQEGRTNAQISQKLYITESTTKKHVSSILAKLNLHHRVEIALYEGRYHK